MHIHILGICGTFMGSLAQLAKAQGHRVTGSDANVYPPMSTQLEQAGVEIIQGYDPGQLDPAPDLVVVGNAMSRGNPAVEEMLNRGIPYTSGPQWLHDHVLRDKWVLAVSGTHGKTTTSSLLAWILDRAGLRPGYLIGGVPGNFGQSARLVEDSSFFVLEADEYDTAFFDKRSKFVHYLPRTLIINNLEFDHADIFPDLAAIQTQFHHLVRIVPENGLIVYPDNCAAIDAVLQRGCWTPCQTFGLDNADQDDNSAGDQHWTAKLLRDDGSRFELFCSGQVFPGPVLSGQVLSGQAIAGQSRGVVEWEQSGEHSVMNGLAAVAAACHVGVSVETALQALAEFKGVKRRMECLGSVNGVTVYDDFAHHPTAIKTTLAGLRRKVGNEKIVALIEPRSNTMRMGMHRAELAQSSTDADDVFWFQPPNMDWSLEDIVDHSPVPAKLFDDIDVMIAGTLALLQPGTHIVIMSNGAFGGIHQKLMQALRNGVAES